MLYLSHPAYYTEVLSVFLVIVRHTPYSFVFIKAFFFTVSVPVHSDFKFTNL